MNGPFRSPNDIAAPEPTEQVCGSPPRSVVKWLKEAAKKKGCSVSHLVSEILKDYVAWARRQSKA
jgi:hypothetical protein